MTSLNNSYQKNGFTFIELLISFTIFCIIAASIYYTVFSGISVWKKTNEVIKVNQRLRSFLIITEKDLKNSLKSSLLENIWHTDELHFLSLVDVYTENGIVSEPARITYRFDEGDEVLIRKTEYFISSLDSEQIILSNVDKLTFGFCYKTSQEDYDYDWQEDWPMDSMPRACKISIELNHPVFNDAKNLEKIIVIPLGNISGEAG